MDDLTLWAGITGFGLPLLIAVINQPQWPGWVRGIVVLAACVIDGAVTASLNGSLTGTSLTHGFLVAATAAIASYRMFWRTTGIASAIEEQTSPGRHRA